MVILAKSTRRAIIDGLDRALQDCSSVDDRLPQLILSKYGDRRISTAMGRLSGNCTVVYDFARAEFGTGEWIVNPIDGSRHYAGDAPLSEVLPFIWEQGEEEAREMPVYIAVWDGYEYTPEVSHWVDDWDNPIQTGGKWEDYSSNIARACAAVIGTLVILHAENPPTHTYGYTLRDWVLGELERDCPDRKVCTLDTWLRGWNGVVRWQGYIERAAVGNFLPWELSNRVTPPSADIPLPPNHRVNVGALPMVGYRTARYGARWVVINEAGYTVRAMLAGGGYTVYHNFLTLHYNWQDGGVDDRLFVTALRSHGVIV